MGAIWILFIPFLVIIYTSSEKKIKKLNKRIKRLEKQKTNVCALKWNY